MVHKICDLNGPGTNSMAYGIYGTDLLIPYVPVNSPDLIGFVGGDSFSEQFLRGDWRSPIILFTKKGELNRWIHSIGGAYAKQILSYVHHNSAGETTRLPTDIIKIGRRLYLHFMVIGKNGLADCRWTGIAYSDDDGSSWQETPGRWKGSDYWGCAQMNTWCDGEDGWIYVMKARGLARDSNVFLFRVRPDLIAFPGSYEPWGFDGTTWGWGKALWPILPDAIKAGELCLRKIEGKFVLSMFRADSGCIEIRMVNQITDNWHTAPTIRPITAAMVPQLYGGYILPGSTLADLKLVVSQWITGRNDPYRAMIWGGISMFAPAFVDPFAAARQRLADFLARFRR
jgi:hypothetical protein